MVKLKIGSAESKINTMKLVKNKCISCVEKDMNTIQGLCLFIHSATLSEKYQQAEENPSEK